MNILPTLTEIRKIASDGKYRKVKTGNPSFYLRKILAEYKSPEFEYLPAFTGGSSGSNSGAQ